MPPNALPTTRSIPTNLRLLILLEEIAAIGEPIKPADLYSRVDLPKPTLHRLLATLENENFLERTLDGRKYSIAARLRRLAGLISSAPQQGSEVLFILQELSKTIGETCNVSRPERDGMKYVDRAETKWTLQINLPVGSTVPFHCTASGKLYLSTLLPSRMRRLVESMHLTRFTSHTITEPEALVGQIAQTRAQGFATDDREFVDGMIGIAVGVYVEQRLIATVSFHAPYQRMDLERARDHLDSLQQAAKRIGAILVPE